VSAITQVWIDDFDDGSVGLDVSAGNGTIAEPLGTELHIGATSPAQCDALTTLNAPFATKLLDAITIPSPGTGLLIAEARVTGLTYSGTGVVPYIVWDFGKTYGLWLGWYPGDSKFYVQGRNGGSGTTLYSSTATYTGPATKPHRWRVLWNWTHDREIRLPSYPSGTPPLAPGYLAFMASIDDGVTWTLHYSTKLSDRNPPSPNPCDIRFGLMCRNVSPWPTFDFAIDYLRLLQTTDDFCTFVPDSIDAPQNDDAAAEDTDSFTSAGGPPSHLLSAKEPGLGGGIFLPSSTSKQIDENTADPARSGSTRSDADFSADGQPAFASMGGKPAHLYPTVTTSNRFGGQEKLSSEPLPAGRVIGEGLSVDDRSSCKYTRPEAAIFDADARQLGGVPTYHTASIDQYGRPHFGNADLRVLDYFVYDTAGELWTTPTNPSFTGYGRDGKYYVNGIDQGSQAPWALETPSNDRGGRADFPNRALVVVAMNELVIFDLDVYPTNLNLWMRFKLGNATDYYMLGRGAGSLQSAAMKNGILAVAGQYTGWEEGRLHLVNFRATGQNCGHLIGASDHWIWTSGYNVTHRNQGARWNSTGPSPELRLVSEYNKHIDLHQVGTSELWCCMGGEDIGSPVVVKISGDVPQLVVTCNGGDAGVDEAGYRRPCLFDRDGNLWFAIDDRLWRNGSDYRAGVIHADVNTSRARSARLPATITQLADDGAYLWVGTTRGVYRVEKGALGYYLAYSIAGGGGGGRLNAPPDGELIPGTVDAVSGMAVVRLEEASYLAVSTKQTSGGLQTTGGGSVLIRLYDDEVLGSKVYPDLVENGAWSHGAIFG
jgi:hypothetical protein